LVRRDNDVCKNFRVIVAEVEPSCVADELKLRAPEAANANAKWVVKGYSATAFRTASQSGSRGSGSAAIGVIVVGTDGTICLDCRSSSDAGSMK
jgi:hypothetical protein